MKKLLILVAVIAATVLSSCSKSNADKAFDLVQSNGNSQDVEKLLHQELAESNGKIDFTGLPFNGELDKMDDGDIDRLSKLFVCSWYVMSEQGSQDVVFLYVAGISSISNDRLKSKYKAMTGNAKKLYDAKCEEIGNVQNAVMDYMQSSEDDDVVVELDEVTLEDVVNEGEW